MDASKIKIIIVATLAIFVSLYLGIAAATAHLEAVAWVVAGVGMTTCLLMGSRIWLLLPIFSALSLKLPLPGNISTL
jgi:hypothetical protein